jgi:putative FmdB family regulatory protein
MPMYDFECTACGHTFETMAKYEEVPECPECHKTETKRLMAAPMVPKGGRTYEWKGAKPDSGRPKTG